MKRLLIVFASSEETQCDAKKECDLAIMEECNFALSLVRNGFQEEGIGEECIFVEDTNSTKLKPSAPPLERLAEAICKMADADIVFFAKGYKNPRNQILLTCATEYGKKTFIHDDTGDVTVVNGQAPSICG